VTIEVQAGRSTRIHELIQGLLMGPRHHQRGLTLSVVLTQIK
jgi:hypothetical protein